MKIPAFAYSVQFSSTYSLHFGGKGEGGEDGGEGETTHFLSKNCTRSGRGEERVRIGFAWR